MIGGEMRGCQWQYVTMKNGDCDGSQFSSVNGVTYAQTI